MNRSLFLLTAYSSIVAPIAFGQRQQKIFIDSRDSPMGKAFPYWSAFLHPRLAYEIPLPPGMRTVVSPSDAPETSFISSDGSFTISAWGGRSTQEPTSLLEDEWRTAQRQPNRTINYRRRSGSWFVVSGTENDGTEFYEKFLSRGTQVAAFTLRYPRARLREFEPWVEKIEDGFRIATHPPRTAAAARQMVSDARSSSPDMAKISSSGATRTAPRRPRVASAQNAQTNQRERPKARAEQSSASKVTAVDLTPPKAATPETKVSEPLAAQERRAPEKSPDPALKSAVKELPAGSKVIGRPGFVYSPYTSDKSLVDVVGIPSGTKVKCPYTNKVFRVP